MGIYATEEEAARAYDRRARSDPRLASRLNFPDDKLGEEGVGGGGQGGCSSSSSIDEEEVEMMEVEGGGEGEGEEVMEEEEEEEPRTSPKQKTSRFKGKSTRLADGGGMK